MKRILFVCNHNAGRSQIAEALFNRFAPDDVRAESAGSHPAVGRLVGSSTSTSARCWPE